MGIGNSRKWHTQPLDNPSPFYRRGSPSGWRQRRGFFRRESFPTIPSAPVGMVQPLSHRALYGSYAAMAPMPFYGQMQPMSAPLQPMSSPFLPMRYNHYAAPAHSYMPAQHYMMPAQRVPTQPQQQQQQQQQPMPSPYLALPAPSMSTPYVHRPQVQPAYQQMAHPRTMPAIMTGGIGMYHPSYPSVPVRLMTDWTGGGKISPGFLGPPI